MNPNLDFGPGELQPPPVPRARQTAILAGNFALLAIFGWVDYASGYELGFFVFYSVPVGLAAWYAGRWPGVAVALGASVTWWLADHFNGVNYSSRFYFYWNLTVHFLAFVINAVTIARIKRELDCRHQLAAELQQARALLRERAEAVCPVCGNQAVRESLSAK